MVDWPVVHERDDGIRPAGAPDRCFYCHKKIGEPHSGDCVIVKRRVLISIKSHDGTITGMWETDEPHSFDSEMIEYMLNDGTWCADNILSKEGVVWDQEDAHKQLESARVPRCLCGVLEFKFERVVDNTPRRQINLDDDWASRK